MSLITKLTEKLDNYREGKLIADLIRIDTRVLRLHEQMMTKQHPFTAIKIQAELGELKLERRMVQSAKMAIRNRRNQRDAINCTKG